MRTIYRMTTCGLAAAAVLAVSDPEARAQDWDDWEDYWEDYYDDLDDLRERRRDTFEDLYEDDFFRRRRAFRPYPGYRPFLREPYGAYYAPYGYYDRPYSFYRPYPYGYRPYGGYPYDGGYGYFGGPGWGFGLWID